MNTRRPTDPRHVAAVLDFMSRAAKAQAVHECLTDGCRRLTTRRICDQCARRDDDLPPAAA